MGQWLVFLIREWASRTWKEYSEIYKFHEIGLDGPY